MSGAYLMRAHVYACARARRRACAQGWNGNDATLATLCDPEGAYATLPPFVGA